MEKKLTYRDAGVDIDAGNYSVKLIKDSVKATYRPEVLGDLGGFGGLFALAFGEAIRVFMQIEENTRKACLLLEKQAERD